MKWLKGLKAFRVTTRDGDELIVVAPSFGAAADDAQSFFNDDLPVEPVHIQNVEVLVEGAEVLLSTFAVGAAVEESTG